MVVATVILKLGIVPAIEHLTARRTHDDVFNFVFGSDACAHLFDPRQASLLFHPDPVEPPNLWGERGRLSKGPLTVGQVQVNRDWMQTLLLKARFLFHGRKPSRRPQLWFHA